MAGNDRVGRFADSEVEYVYEKSVNNGGDKVTGVTTNTVKSPIVQEMVNRIANRCHPQKIILFGSRARGDARSDSDFDLLIIAPSDEPRWHRTIPLYRLLAGLGVPKDIVWWTPEEVAEWRNVKSHFINAALREGRVLYESAT